MSSLPYPFAEITETCTTEVMNLVRVVTQTLGVSILIYFVYDKINRNGRGQTPPGTARRRVNRNKSFKGNKAPKDVSCQCEMSDDQTVNKGAIVPLGHGKQHDTSDMAEAGDNEAKNANEAGENDASSVIRGQDRVLTDGDKEGIVSSLMHHDQRAVEDALREEIAELKQAVATGERHFRDVRTEMLKERTKADLVRQEVKVQEELWEFRANKMAEELSETRARLEESQRNAKLSRETLQKTIQGLRSSLEERDLALTEREESNALLRRDLMDTLTKFQSEKEALSGHIREMERRVSSLGQDLNDKSVAMAALGDEVCVMRVKLDKRSREKKKLVKLNARLQKEVEDLYKHNARGLKVSRMLEHIENID